MRSTRFHSALRTSLLLIVLFSLIWMPASAQTQESISISAPDSSAFPNISFLMEAANAEGQFVDTLKPEDVVILENGSERPAVKLQQEQPGLQIILAINAAPVFENHYSGVSRFEAMQKTLGTWARTQPFPTQDDFSLATNTGLQLTRSVDPTQWAQSLQDYKPVLLNTIPNLNSLNSALDLATDPNPRENMKRVILYLTPLPNPASLKNLPELTRRAEQLGVRIFIWLVAPASAGKGEPGQPLRDLAKATGGEVFVFSGPEELPNPENYLRALRSVYRVTYTSAIKKSGSQRISAQVTSLGRTLQSNERTFSLRVEPPIPLLLAPPASVERAWVKEGNSFEKTLQPSSIALRILTEFPDGHQRTLRRSTLYVDGQKEVENLQAPFDAFVWDLEGYTTSQRHTIQVEVEDELGLTNRSIEMPIDFSVEEPAANPLSGVIANRRLLIGGLVLLGAAALVGGAIYNLRRVRKPQQRKESVTLPAHKRNVATDPVTQPVDIPQDSFRGAVITTGVPGSDRPSWPRTPTGPVPARLVRLDENLQPTGGASIPLAYQEMTLGSDPQQAIFVIEAPGVSPLHARLRRLPEGGYLLADAGSVAGTWINYAPISAQGARLEQDDIIHIGRAAFRFELANPPAQRSIHVQDMPK